MTYKYTHRVRENILPLSMAGTLPEAFEEWYFADEIFDHEKAGEECQLCNQEQLRYHFKITNKYTKYLLWVGSQCILKFQLQVFEHGHLLNAKESKKKLDKLMKKMRLDSCIKSLEHLAMSENNDIFNNALSYYKTNKFLTPKYAFVVFWRLAIHNIDHNPSFFKISLRKDKYKRDLAQMEIDRVHYIWPALTISQRKVAENFGHKPPQGT